MPAKFVEEMRRFFGGGLSAGGENSLDLE